MKASRFLAVFGILSSWQLLFAAQSGPYFPTHRFPSDRSFHFSYKFGYLSQVNNFDANGDSVSLIADNTLVRYRHQLIPEYQPSRAFSFGAFLNFDGVQLNDSAGNSDSKGGFSDQVIFGEYRFFDIKGASVGLAVLTKFPLYKNITAEDLRTDTDTNPVLLGDAQSDFTAMFTGEFWPSKIFRIRADFGYSFRQESYATEIPYLLGLGFATTKLDVDFRVKGNFSRDNDALASDVSTTTGTDSVRRAFGGSNYALSGNPSAMIAEVYGEFWIDPLWGLSLGYERSLSGKNSIQFWQFAGGLTYRWAERDTLIRRRVREVDIDTDQEQGIFDAEAKPSGNEERFY